MTPRRVLLRIKKLRRFLDERIADAARERGGADEPESRAEAAGRLAAYQEVRGEMVGERLDLDEDELGLDAGGGAEAGSSSDADGEEADAGRENADAAEAEEEAEGARSGG